MTHLTSLKLAVPEKGHKQVAGTSCLPALQSLSLEPERLDEHCLALVKLATSGSLDNISIDIVLGNVTTDMLKSFVRELVSYPPRAFSVTGTLSNISYDGRLNISEAALHALQPLLLHRKMASLKISMGNLRITPNLLSALGSAYPAL
ncbi:uncharacterized protein LAESUDRAFT_751503 [Laetiporus sulphureus 93-53]|uniref:Uncharacterized protein n=1 Tax=Laetiporus sulphureus 93-53 TaxID=1314785 RepID=A0A165CXF4_9APHY|nr:uncharacterized protein LAESUDRAFT_751503 [Laetiporus sulphureus 93-53]KZT03668.1 hypothetical protein LAESUDRAFT_751503 [Laetiporus sulphureus 93-53]